MSTSFYGNYFRSPTEKHNSHQQTEGDIIVEDGDDDLELEIETATTVTSTATEEVITEVSETNAINRIKTVCSGFSFSCSFPLVSFHFLLQCIILQFVDRKRRIEQEL